jgi:hypothetical protein
LAFPGARCCDRARGPALIDDGKLVAPLDRTFAFEDIAKAFNYSAGPGTGGVSSGQHGARTRKIVVVMR